MAPKTLIPLLLLSFAAVLLFSCSKSSGPGGGTIPPTGGDPYKLKYPDSILYLKNQESPDYIVYPTQQRAGSYSGFPEGIEVDDKTGAINVSKSETGLRYRITYTSPNGDTSTALVVISGITFTDQFYRLSTGDSIAAPVYNSSSNRVLPLAGSVFDEGNGANSGGCSIKTTNGKINLAESVRNGIFGSVPKNDERKDFEIVYRINDNSRKAVNKLKVRLYYYNRMSDVAPDLLETLLQRQQDGVFIGGKNGAVPGPGDIVAAKAKPRPPCVVIVAN